VSATAPVRKRITVLFSDVAGSTALGESLDAEPLLRIMSRYFEEMSAVIERHGGRVAKFIGDAVMAVFGLPTVREDDAVRAVRAAAEMRDRLKVLNEELRREQGVVIEVRTGINTGEVLAGTDVGEALALGDPVNVAARLEQAAAPGEILLGEATYDLVLDAVAVEDVYPLVIKGKSRPLRAYRLVAVTPHGPGVARHLTSPMVGRAADLAALKRAFEEVVAEQSCRMVTVVGEAGLGKSRLTTEFISSVDRTALVITGRCLSYGEGITFWPLAEAIREAAGILSADGPDEAVGKIEALLSRDPDAKTVVRHLAVVLGLKEGQYVIEETFWATRRLFESLAGERPLVIVFDDIHWAESMFLDLLDYLRSFCVGRSILFICQARPDLFERRPEWRADGFVIRLAPLSREESGRVIDNQAAGARLDAVTRERIGEAAEGNPLFVEEMLRMMSERAQEPTGGETPVDIPPTIQALLDARLEALPDGERAVLQRASVIGKVFAWKMVADLSPPEDRNRLGSMLQALVRRELIAPERGSLVGEDAFRFSHILVRDAAYRGLPKETRAKFHFDLAAGISRQSGERVAELDEIVGYHFERAYFYRAELGVIGADERMIADRAASHLISSGQRAVLRGDSPASINLLTRAAALLPENDPRRLRLSPDLGDALRNVGQIERAREVFRQAIEQAESIGHEHLRAHAAVGYWLSFEQGEDEALREAERALEVFATEQDELGLSRAWRLVASMAFEAGDGAKADAALDRALEHARRSDEAHELAEVYTQFSAQVTRGPMPVGTAIARCEEILAEAGDSIGITAAMCHALAHLRARQGAFEEARSLVRIYRQTRHDLGWTARYWVSAEAEGDVEMLAGRPDRAVEVMREGFRRYQELTGEESDTLAAYFLARALYQVDQLDEARRIASVAVRSGFPLVHHLGQGVMARLLARDLRLDEAEAMAREANAFYEQTDFLTDHAMVVLDLVEVLRLAGRRDEAAAQVRRAVELNEQKEDSVSAHQALNLLAELTA
jgi:class 3 adenylate cyclase/predicted ATPase